MNKVKERRISNPGHIRKLLSEQINRLRQDESLDKIEVARAIAYLSNVHLSAYKNSVLLDKIEEVEKLLNERFWLDES